MRRVVFVSKTNMDLSLIAANLAHSIFDRSILVECASTEPDAVPLADWKQILAEADIPVKTRNAKLLRDLGLTNDDLVILLNLNQGSYLPELPTRRVLTWDFPSLVLEAEDKDDNFSRFRDYRNCLHKRIIETYGSLCLERGQPKYWRHYKGNEYRVLAMAYHSETQEPMVSYQTLYHNKLSQNWVRPLDMFISSVTLDSKITPRFKPCPLIVTQKNSSQIYQCMPLIRQLFPGNSEESINACLMKHRNPSIFTVEYNERLFGFKIGYGFEDIYYSWLGGVDPNYRGLGVASELLVRQHLFAKSEGYRIVRTVIPDIWPDMLRLNLRQGFKVVGTDNKAPPRLILEKKLQ